MTKFMRRGRSPRRVLATVGAVCAVAGTLAACGGNSSSSGKIQLSMTWWGNPARSSATTAAVKLFEKQNPNITVRLEPADYSGYYNKLNTEISAGTAPDIFQDQYNLVQYADGGALADLGNYSAELTTTDISASVLQQGQYNGKQYGLFRIEGVAAGASVPG